MRMSVISVALWTCMWMSVGGQRAAAPVLKIPDFDKVDLTTSNLEASLFSGLDRVNFNIPKLCFKGAVLSQLPGLCVARSRCQSSDQSGSGACGSGEICCNRKHIGQSSGGSQQLVQDCGRPTPDDHFFFSKQQPSRVSGLQAAAFSPRGAAPVRLQRSPRTPQMVQAAPTRPPIVPPVVGGTDVPVSASLPVGRWPWMALLGTRQSGRMKWQCGGVVLSSDAVLTAAHCVSALRSRPRDLTVRLGEYDISTTGDGPGRHVDVGVSRIIIHPNYRGSQNDIAVLRLSRGVSFSARVRPVCLPPPNADHTGQRADLAGWGRLNFGDRTSDTLQEVTVLIVDEKRCETAYRGLGSSFTQKFPGGFQGTKICANGEDGRSRDACQGDSGGPLVVQDKEERYQVVGIVSGGNGCGNPEYPGIYTKVSKYISWILDNSS